MILNKLKNQTDRKINTKKYKFWSKAWRQRYLFLMSMPFFLWLIVFKYIPIYGWITAFQDYKIWLSPWEQEWVGLKYFIEVLTDERFWRAFRNTIAMSTMGLVAGYTVPIIFALFLNEVRHKYFKRSIQTVSYLPHFVSWVVVASMFIKLLSSEGGAVNKVLISLGLLSEPVQFMAQPKLFWIIVTIASLWKELGWSTIIYLAAMAGINPQLYEAATMDGCGRFKKMWYITLPSIAPTIIILFILSFGKLTQIGFEKQLLLGNSIVMDYAEVIDLYVLKYGIGTMRYAFGTAVGVFNSLIAITLLVTANTILKKVRGESVY